MQPASEKGFDYSCGISKSLQLSCKEFQYLVIIHPEISLNESEQHSNDPPNIIISLTINNLRKSLPPLLTLDPIRQSLTLATETTIMSQQPTQTVANKQTQTL